MSSCHWSGRPFDQFPKQVSRVFPTKWIRLRVTFISLSAKSKVLIGCVEEKSAKTKRACMLCHTGVHGKRRETWESDMLLFSLLHPCSSQCVLIPSQIWEDGSIQPTVFTTALDCPLYFSKQQWFRSPVSCSSCKVLALLQHGGKKSPLLAYPPL